MTEIQILSSEIVNQIAAGEVVERPSHLVKELVENSLDAGSTEVSIEVSAGGKSIRIIDNGEGIMPSDLTKAFQRHATSKISKTDDLWNLNTFGFRGEALASAAAVSKMTLLSRKKDAEQAFQVRSDFGVMSEILPGSPIRGTEIKVESLFENVPARLKFLKTDTTEVSQIKNVIKAMALSYPEVQFKLSSEGRLDFFYQSKKSYLERAKDIFEIQELYHSVFEQSGFKVEVVFASPQQVARSSKNIWIFAQNRWIQDRAIQAAIMDAFRSLLMHGEYPIVAVWLTCPAEQIDVNIHPTKSQVKFQDSSLIFRLVQNTLRQALEKAPWVPQFTSKNISVDYSQPVQSIENLKFFDHAFEKTQFKNKSIPAQEFSKLSVQPINNFFTTSDTAIEVRTTDTTTNEVMPGYWSSLQVIGQANLTYIICQKADRLIYVDQHAAHERVAYESLMESFRSGKFEIQEYLFPLNIDLNAEKIEALLKHQDDIQKLGVQVEQMGPETLGVKSAPSLLKDSSLPAVLEKIAEDVIEHGGSFALEKKVSDLMATLACHSVIRAGQSLSLEEMQELLRSMDQYRLSSFCPHGRPVSIEVTFNEMERLFGRIT